MNYPNPSFLFLIVIFSIISCSEYCEGECIGEDPSVYFNVWSQSDSTNLVFGDQNIYNVEDMQAYSVEGSDSTFYTISSYDPAVSDFPALKFEHGDFDVSTVYLKLDDSDTDTLDLHFVNLKSECCFDLFRLNTLDLNGIEIDNQMSGDFFVEIYK